MEKVLWVEAQAECKELEQNLARHGRQKDVVAITAVSDREGEATLFRTDNSISTSLKPLGGDLEASRGTVGSCCQVMVTRTTSLSFSRLSPRRLALRLWTASCPGSV